MGIAVKILEDIETLVEKTPILTKDSDWLDIMLCDQALDDILSLIKKYKEETNGFNS
jgi:Mg2+ and Co2+ transporter CorA